MKRAVIVLSLTALGAFGLGCSKKLEEPPPPPKKAAAPATDASTASAEYVGTAACTECHQEQHDAWQGSHHDLAMQVATEATVLGDFDDAKERYYDETARFYRREGRFFVEALSGDGKLTEYPVTHTFGVEPLQQYLVEVEPGRLQSFPFAWDTRPKADGGQRWFHLQAEEYIEPGDPLHWTGPSYNWNHACADCHSTALQKNYDRASRRFSTDYVEIDVGCEACHGGGARHVSLVEAEGDLLSGAGFERRFPTAKDRAWVFEEGRSIAVLRSGESREPEACAPCHSRRADLGGDYDRYHDRYRLSLIHI